VPEKQIQRFILQVDILGRLSLLSGVIESTFTAIVFDLLKEREREKKEECYKSQMVALREKKRVTFRPVLVDHRSWKIQV
jgi:hypothetical protein